MPAAIKTALRVLIREIGGVEAAASVVGRAVSRVSDWQNHAKPNDLPSLDQVLALEAVAPRPRITEAMARAAGWRLEAVGQGDVAPASVVTAAGRLMQAGGQVAVEVGAAIADGSLTEVERIGIATRAVATRDECDAVLAALAGDQA
ncbi:hypothetical protein [Elioraea sp.]|uniref:hypothetical protein n=1 Tax=Elioraea sp. TaxID=2185103 RepID=UPI0025BAC3B0|nr:hypothetical protein [Elioraea sp.]